MSLQKKNIPVCVFHALSHEEIDNPQLVLDDLFDFADLNDLKQLLWDWLKTTVTGTYHKQLNSTDRTMVLVMYEKMEKLIEAAYLLKNEKQRRPKKQKPPERHS